MPIRPATHADAPAIAGVHAASWRTTYAGLIPDEVIAARTEEQLTAQWQRNLAAERVNVLVATDADAEIIGFASCGPCRDPEDAARFAGELYAIYLLQAAQGQGTGRDLVRAVAEWLAGQGMASMIVWVLTTNPARHFYAALGGQYVREKTEGQGSAMLHEVGYGWDDISLLRSAR
jgi:L-amino acid N-acyltransferase YncA